MFAKCLNMMNMISMNMMKTKMFSWTPILRHCVSYPNLIEDFYVCQMPEYDEKRKCPPRLGVGDFHFS